MTHKLQKYSDAVIIACNVGLFIEYINSRLKGLNVFKNVEQMHKILLNVINAQAGMLF